MPEMVKVLCLRSVRVSDDGIRNRMIEPSNDPVLVPLSALAGLVAEGYVADLSAASNPVQEPQADNHYDQDADAPKQALALKHVGFGNWVVVDGDGNRLTEPMTKAEAAAALAVMASE